MNTDFRISIGLVSHPKALKMMRRCGDRSFYCLVHLWGWAAQYRPDGNLFGMDNESIEIAADWQGDDGLFVKTLHQVSFLDGSENEYSLHDWCEHNPWACGSEKRSDEGRLNKLASKFPEKVKELKSAGVSGISRDQYETYLNKWTLSKPKVTPKQPLSQPSTPTPTPTPTPSPTPTPTPRVEVDVEGEFAMTADWEPSEFFQTLAATAGIAPLEGDDLKLALQEFVPFWMTKNRKRTSHEWDLAFIKAIKSGFSSARNGPRAGGKNVHRLSPRQAYMQEVGELLERIDGIDTDGRTESIGKVAQPLPGSRPQLIDHKQASP